MKFENYIIKGIGGFYYVKTEQGVLECRAKGVFRKRGITPVAGDYVTLEQEAGTFIIAEILPRKNVFVRPPIANVDQFFIVVSTEQPGPNFLVIDKLSAIAVSREARPVLLWTKADLQSVKPLMEKYAHSKILSIEMNEQGREQVKEMLCDKISVFCGNSGVGKSTLLTALIPEISLKTGEISKKLGRGRHTTREVQLYEAFGGLVADTPGFSSLDMERAASISKEELQFAFPEIEHYFGQCQFTGCSHTVEKGCAVRDALQTNEIDVSRYESYTTLYREAQQKEEWQR